MSSSPEMQEPLLKGFQPALVDRAPVLADQPNSFEEASTMHNGKKGINFREWV